MNQEKSIHKVVVKVGTNVLTRPDGLLDITAISQLIDQIATLKRKGIQIILISSGAVGAGKAVVQLSGELNKVVSRQVYAAVGQIKLMNIYLDLFSNYDLYCAQVLATKEDFRDRIHYLNMKECFRALLRDQIIPIVNENDVISVSELMFTDNDELAGLIAAMTDADALIILSNVDGIYDGHPEEANSRVIHQIFPGDKKHLSVINPTRSTFGRGGMHTKARIAQKAAGVGITTFIANGKKAGILLEVLEGNAKGTTFVAKEQVSNVKKWIAYNESGKKGQVLINEGASNVLCDKNKVSSLLPVGILQIDGAFEKGDIVEIVCEKKGLIGMGIAQYSSATAANYLGKSGKKALVHYDYLYIEAV
ncbi:MAG: glutamate 5-kinase [Bacteroidota bacterium]